MLYWQEEFVEEAPGAIVVEIAPVATALAIRYARSAARPAVRRARGDAGGLRPEDREGRGGSAERGAAFAGRARSGAAEADASRGDAEGRDQGGDEPAGAASRRSRPRPPRPTAPRHIDAPDRHQVGGARRRHRGQQRAQHRDLAEFGGAAPQPAQALSGRGSLEGPCRAMVQVRFSMDRGGQLMASQVARSSGFAPAGRGGARAAQARVAAAAPCLWPCRARRCELIVPIRFRIK